MKSTHFVLSCVLLIAALAAAQTNPIPLINQPLVPASVAPGGTGFTLTVSGADFASGALVMWNGSTRPTSVVSSHTVQAQISAADVATKGTAWLTVRNPHPGGGLSNVVFFGVRNAAEGLGFAQKNTAVSTGGYAVLGDFNRDGKLDVATTSGAHTIQVWFGKGDGTFQSPVDTVIPSWVMGSLAAGDFNGDGKLDLAVSQSLTAHQSDEHIGVLLGKGDGTFTHKLGLSIKTQFLYPVGDFNGDGNLDLATSNRGGDGYFVEVLAGNGDGTFQELFFQGGRNPAFGDFDGDGRLDVATADEDNQGKTIVAVHNSGGKNAVYPVSFGGGAIAAVDVNGDGKLDLVTDGVSVLLNNGDGTFRDAGGVTSPDGGSINVGDFNGDGKIDVASNANIFLGNGDGTFQAPLAFGAPARIFGAGDFNRDGKLDLLSLGESALSVLVQIRVYLGPPDLELGDIDVGTTSPPQTATLTNFIPGSSLTINKIKIVGANAADFAQTNNCASTLPPNGSCQIQVTFSPSQGGSEIASLSVSYKDSGSPLTVYLFGYGVVVNSTVTLTPSTMTFGPQLVGTPSLSQGATLTNTGNQPVNISSVATSAPFSQTNNCPATLPVGGNCGIQVTFTPTDPAVVHATLSVVDDAVGSPQTVSLTGTGTAVILSPISINFGNQKVGTQSAPVPITLTNAGKSALPITQITIKGTNPGDFTQMNDCGNSVPAQGKCTITVTFTPTATGARSAQVSISDSDPTSPQTVPLSGKGT